MKTIEKEISAAQEIKKSSFIAYLAPLASFETLRARLRQQHPKARHIVWAYRALNEPMQIVENSSDDGEPKSTAGVPCLNALRGAELINAAVLVVRYFGGIKLGTGGLVRAYASSANLAIEAAASSGALTDFFLKRRCAFFVPFATVAKFEHFLKKSGFVYEASFGDAGAEFSAELSAEEFEKFMVFAQGFTAPFKITQMPKF
nr:YigZ family protein [uncultured Campylobacter sp.]